MSKMFARKAFILDDNLVIVTSAPKSVVNDCLCGNWESDEEMLEDISQKIKSRGYEYEHYFAKKMQSYINW